MNILFDFNHPVDVNFFKNAIKIITSQNNNVFLIYRDRGRLKDILYYELGSYSPVCFGKHQKSIPYKVIHQLVRDFNIVQFQKNNDINLSVCFGSTNAIASRLNHIPYLAFDDDCEYKIPFWHANLFSTRHIMPDYIEIKRSNIFKYHGYKELAYLHPTYFKPKLSSIANLGLKPDNYVFIREIAPISINYYNKDSQLKEVVSLLKSYDYKVVLSLEDKDLTKQFEKNCIILQEPVTDFYSILKYAAFAISSGDTLAREACLLGLPCIYTGGRNMAINKQLIELGFMYKADTLDEVISRINKLIKYDYKTRIGHLVSEKIMTEWANTTQVILQHITDFCH